jgi:hypothetical protein
LLVEAAAAFLTEEIAAALVVAGLIQAEQVGLELRAKVLLVVLEVVT